MGVGSEEVENGASDDDGDDGDDGDDDDDIVDANDLLMTTGTVPFNFP